MREQKQTINTGKGAKVVCHKDGTPVQVDDLTEGRLYWVNTGTGEIIYTHGLSHTGDYDLPPALQKERHSSE